MQFRAQLSNGRTLAIDEIPSTTAKGCELTRLPRLHTIHNTTRRHHDWHHHLALPCPGKAGRGWHGVVYKAQDSRLGRFVADSIPIIVSQHEVVPKPGRSQREDRYVTPHVLQEDFNLAPIAADAFACRRRAVWRELVSRRLQASACQTLRLVTGIERRTSMNLGRTTTSLAGNWLSAQKAFFGGWSFLRNPSDDFAARI